MNGLFDFQVNGFGGVDFQRDDLTLDELRGAFDLLADNGAERIFVTLITAKVDVICRRLERFQHFCHVDPTVARMIAGYHIEGPWLSPLPGFCGAHSAELMHAPEIAEYLRMQQAAEGRIKLVTLAPEWPKTPEVIAKMRTQGVHVALGHTNASEADIESAIQAGARFCTHLGNGVPASLPRHDNITQRLLARDELIACLIPDGVHLPRYVLQNFWRAKPAGRVLFTTDAMAGGGLGPGRFRIGELEVDVDEAGIAWRPDRTGFAGSTLTPANGVRNVAAWLGLDLTEATRLWSSAPEAAFGLTTNAVGGKQFP